MNLPTSKPQFLTIEEKRAWLARIFRDSSGEYTDADKFKAMQEDTNLALISQKKQLTTPCAKLRKIRLSHTKNGTKSAKTPL